MTTNTHMSEWLMSSKVAEADRYLKQEHTMHKLADYYIDLGPRQS